MKPVKFEEHNIEIGKDQEEYGTLPAFVDKEVGAVVYCMELSEEELLEVVKTRQIWVSQMTMNSPMQPIFITGKKEEVICKL